MYTSQAKPSMCMYSDIGNIPRSFIQPARGWAAALQLLNSNDNSDEMTQKNKQTVNVAAAQWRT